MKCNEIGRPRWFSDVLHQCLDCGICTVGIWWWDGAGQDVVNLVRRWCDQMLMWDSGCGHLGLKFQRMKIAREGKVCVRIWNMKMSEGETCWGGRFLFEQYGKLWRWWVLRNICRGGKNKIIKKIIFIFGRRLIWNVLTTMIGQRS